jgi:hypothetical protein
LLPTQKFPDFGTPSAKATHASKVVNIQEQVRPSQFTHPPLSGSPTLLFPSPPPSPNSSSFFPVKRLEPNPRQWPSS